MKQQDKDTHLHHIPDIDIIDLEDDGKLENDYATSAGSPQNTAVKGSKNYEAEYFPLEEHLEEVDLDGDLDEDFGDDNQDEPPKKGIRSFLNMHVIFAITAVFLIGGIFFSIKNWGVKVDLDEIFKDGEGEYSDTLDSILPLLNDSGVNPADDGVTNIVCFGNAPFADDRGSEDNLANIIARETGATVYNCSVGESYLAALSPFFDSNNQPLDAYNFYWLVTLATKGPIEHFFADSAETLGDATPAEAEEVFNTLTTLDFNKVDVVAIMYDASDYLAGHYMYNDANHTDISYFTGNMEAGIELLKSVYPHIRIIVLSPTYAFAVDDNGEYVSSDIMTYGGMDVLSTYVIKQSASAAVQSVSFEDYLYGTINEDNAKEYLTDNLHLNVKGRKAVAKRFVEALNYYND